MANFTIDDSEENTRLDRFIRRQAPATSQGQIEKLLRGGKIRLNGLKAKSNSRLTSGDEITLPDFLLNQQPDISTPEAEAAKAQDALAAMELARSEDWIAYNKPSGLAVQGGAGMTRHLDGLLMTAYADDRPKLVHRLDKDTSGLIIVARHMRAARGLTRAFADHQLQKSYLAICIGDPGAGGSIDLPLIKSGPKGGEKMLVDRQEGQSALTYFKRLAHHDGFSLVALSPQTGRTHQLRVHMSALGIPILGDGKYGGGAAHPEVQLARKLHLHAQFLRLPDGSLLVAPVADHFARTLAQLNFARYLPDTLPEFDHKIPRDGEI